MWNVRVATNESASRWSHPFGPYLTKRAAVRRGQLIGRGVYAVRAEPYYSDHELLTQIVDLLTEIRDGQQKAHKNGNRLTADPLGVKRVP